MSASKIRVKLDPRECALILKYGYPFEAVESIAKISVAKEKPVFLDTDKYWLELLIGDLSYSANRITSESILEELDALCVRFESECKNSL